MSFTTIHDHPPATPLLSSLHEPCPPTESADKDWTVPKIASKFGVDQMKVHTWIRNGELDAINVATNSTGRPIWRIENSALDAFKKSRAAIPALPTPRRTRSKRSESTQYFA